MEAGIPTAVLMCHAPIVIPEVAGAEAGRVAQSTRAMEEAAERVVASGPDVVAVVSPHAPREPDSWSIASDQAVGGDFSRFGVPGVGVSLAYAERAASAIEREAKGLGLTCFRRPLGLLDHGSLVPLWFLEGAGWKGPTVRLAFPWQPTHEGCDAMGHALVRAAASRGERWALIASGDMSHRLTRGAPAGYAPEGAEFDAQVRQHVERGDYRAVRTIDPELRERAAEDVVDSLDVAAGAVGAGDGGHRVLSYEGPFGVGYLVAVLRDAQ